ncbi:hypothetical protein [Microbaculum marinum]|uniref:hypothetical protein n=1 Tax=Microbaculum marinum TaxID=1764581 RepID=UPI00366DCE5E
MFVEAVRLLLNIPLAARSEDFGQALRDIGLTVGNRPELLDLVASAAERLDTVRRETRSRSDLGEIAARALTRTLSSSMGDTLPSLFGATPDDVQAVARRMSWSKGISGFTREFFGSLVSGTLSYWLDRTLAVQIGEGRRFPSATARNAFDSELDRFSSEATRIIQEFSSGWYGKTLHGKGGFGTGDAATFGAVALKKTVSELRARGAKDV